VVDRAAVTRLIESMRHGRPFGSSSYPNQLLQLEDGSYAGTAEIDSGEQLIVFTKEGHISWTLAGYSPEYALQGGGVAALVAQRVFWFDSTGNAVGTVTQNYSYSWSNVAYTQVKGGLTQEIQRAKEFATGYESFRDANPGLNGTAVAAFGLAGLPIFGLKQRGPGCTSSSSTQDKVSLGGSALSVYAALRDSLLNNPQLTAPSACANFFNAESFRA
jgi:hypothetical protein